MLTNLCNYKSFVKWTMSGLGQVSVFAGHPTFWSILIFLCVSYGFMIYHDFPMGFPIVSMFRVCIACATTSCCGPLWCLWWQMWEIRGCESLFETVQKQLTAYILGDDPYRWEVNKNPQLHSFDPSMDLRCLGSDFTHLYTIWTWQIQMDQDQDLENVFSRYVFLGDGLLEFHVWFRAAKFPRYPSLNYLKWPYWPWNLEILTQVIIPAIPLHKIGSFYAIFDLGPILHGFDAPESRSQP